MLLITLVNSQCKSKVVILTDSFALQLCSAMASAKPVSVQFQVFGDVQGLYFKTSCQEECTRANVGGWIKNSSTNSVIGMLQGPRASVEKITKWLNNGSPGSRIKTCELRNWAEIDNIEIKKFSVRL